MSLPALQDTLLEPIEPEKVELELDELWSFVRRKGNQRWIWFALCKATRQVVACVIGGRGEATCQRLWHTVPKSYRRGVVYTDFWRAYQAVIPDQQHQAVGKETGLTNHIERFNNTLRQRTGPEAAKPVRCCFKAKTGAALSKTTSCPLRPQSALFL